MEVRTLLKEIEDGELVLPEFQRDFVWKKPDVKKFMNSLYRNYPSGNLLIWKTKTPPKLRGGDLEAGEGYTKVILDGQQRLSTLYSFIIGQTPPYYVANNLDFNLYFNLEDERFEYYQPKKMSGRREWLSIIDFFHSSDAGNFIQECEDEELQRYYISHMSKLNKLSNIRMYEYFVDEDKLRPDMDLEEVVNIFNLVNKEGRTLQESDLALAHISVFLPELKAWMREEIDVLKHRGL